MPNLPLLWVFAFVAVGLAGTATAGIVVIQVLMPTNDGHGYTTIVAMTTAAIPAIIGGLISIANGQKANTIIQQNEHIHTCAHDIKDEAAKAAKFAEETKKEVADKVETVAAVVAKKTEDDKKEILAAVKNGNGTTHVDGELKLVVGDKEHSP